jgi:MFS family permease
MLFLSTLLFAVGTSPATLVVARCLQGAAAGIVYTVGLAMLVDTVGRDEVASWMGLTLSGMTSGVMIGPMLGGLIYAKVGYYAVFVVVLAVITLDLLLQLFMVEKETADKWLKSPTGGSGYGTISNKQDDDHDSRSPSSIEDQEVRSRPSSESCTEEDPSTREISYSTTQGSNQDERYTIAKYLAKRFPTTYALLSSGRLVAAMYGGFVQVALICSFDSILPIFVYRKFGWDSSATGLIFLAISIPSLAGPVAGALSDRLGARIVVLTGFTLSSVALALLSLVAYDSVQQKVLLSALLASTGTYLSFFLTV